MQLLVMAMGVYKVWIMGLLPTSGSDFLAWKSERPVSFPFPCMFCAILMLSCRRWNGVFYNFAKVVYSNLHAMPVFPKVDTHYHKLPYKTIKE